MSLYKIRVNALSLGVLFYHLQSQQPFTSNPWALIWAGTTPGFSRTICLLLSLPICHHVSLSSHLLAYSNYLCTSLCFTFVYLPLSLCRTCPSIISVCHNSTGTAVVACQEVSPVPILLQNHIDRRLIYSNCKYLCLCTCNVAMLQPSATATGTSTLESK